MIEITHAALTDKGLVRQENEDAFAVDQERGIYIVSDGMGGEMAGEVASRIVSEVLPKFLIKELEGLENPADQGFIDKVDSAIVSLSAAVHQASKGKPNLEGMGATLVLAVIKGAKALIANVGDSRAYLLRKGTIEQITKDHSVVQYLIDAGEISKTEADEHPLRGQLLRCMGMQGAAHPECFLLDLKPRDKILLCSDGLTDMLTDENMRRIVASTRTPKSACAKLVSAANGIGGVDNITALVIAVSDGRKSRNSRKSQGVQDDAKCDIT